MALCQPFQQRTDVGWHRHQLHESRAVGLDQGVRLQRVHQRLGEAIVPAAIARRGHQSAHAGQHTHDPLAKVHLAKLRHLLRELAIALLLPGRHEGLRVERSVPSGRNHAQAFHDPGKVPALDRYQRIAEVEADRPHAMQHPLPNRLPTVRHRTALDGQISRYGQ